MPVVTISKEVDDAKWFSVNEAVNMLVPGSVIQGMVKDIFHV